MNFTKNDIVYHKETYTRGTVLSANRAAALIKFDGKLAPEVVPTSRIYRVIVEQYLYHANPIIDKILAAFAWVVDEAEFRWDRLQSRLRSK